MIRTNVILGSGPLGLAVTNELVRQGEQVRLVNTSGVAHVVPAVEIMRADLYDMEQTYRAMKDASTVYLCAGPPYHKWSQQFVPLVDNVLEGAIRRDVQLVYGDNLYVYGNVQVPMHENLPEQPSTKKGKVRALAASRLLDAHKRGDARVAIGRGSDFFGPHVRGSMLGERVFSHAVSGKAASVLGNPDVLHSYTYIEDFGKALVALAQHEDSFGQVWHVPSVNTRTTRQVIDTLYECVGEVSRLTAVGRISLYLAGVLAPQIRETIEMLYQFEEPFVVDDRKFRHRFGMVETPLEVSIARTVEWYKARGKFDTE